MAHNSFRLSLRHSLLTEILNTTKALSIIHKRMVRLNVSIECSKTVYRPLALKVKSGKLLWWSFYIYTEQLHMQWQNCHLLNFCIAVKLRQNCMWEVFLSFLLRGPNKRPKNLKTDHPTVTEQNEAVHGIGNAVHNQFNGFDSEV